MKYELNHDAIAKQIFDKTSGEMRARRTAEKLVKDAFTLYQKRQALLSKEQLEEILPYRNTASFSDDELLFINKSEKAIKDARRKKLILGGVIIISLLALTTVAVVQWRQALSRERLANATRLAITAKLELDRRNYNDAFQLAHESLLLQPDNTIAEDLLSQIFHRNSRDDLFYPLCIETFYENTAIENVVFDDDSYFIATSLNDGTVKVRSLHDDLTSVDIAIFDECDAAFKPVFAPDASSILVLKRGEDSVLCLNHINQTQKQIQLRGHREFVRGAAFLNKDSLISWGNDGCIKLWRIDGTFLKNIGQLNGWVMEVQIADDKSSILAKSNSNEVGVFNFNNEKPFILKHKASVLAARFVNQDSVITLSTDSVPTQSVGVQMWSRKAGGRVGDLLSIPQLEHVSQAAFSSEGSTLMYQTEEGRIVNIISLPEFFKYKSGQLTVGQKMLLRESGIRSLSDEDFLRSAKREFFIKPKLYGSTDGYSFWMIEKGSNEVQFKFGAGDTYAIITHDQEPTGIAVNGNRTRFVTFSENGTVKIWGSRLKKLPKFYDICQDRSVGTTAQSFYSPNGLRVVTTAQRSPMRWYFPDGNLLKTFQGFDAQEVRFSADGKYAVAYPQFGQPVLFDSTAQTLKTLTFDSDKKGIRISPDDAVFCIIGKNKIGVWDRNGTFLHDKIRTNEEILAAEFAPDGKRLVVAARDNTLTEWHIDGNTSKTILQNQRILALSFSPTGRELIIGNAEGKASLLKTDGSVISSALLSNARISNVQFFPDGEHFLCSDDANQSMIVNTQTQARQYLFNGRTTNQVQIFPDGKHLLVGFNQSTELWHLEKGKITQLHNNVLSNLRVPTHSTIASDNERILLTYNDCTAQEYWTPAAILNWLAQNPSIRFGQFEKRRYSIR